MQDGSEGEDRAPLILPTIRQPRRPKRVHRGTVRSLEAPVSARGLLRQVAQ